jgi:NAD-dependent deacetylase
MINKSKKMVIFSGAGLSSESGIPTYRGNDGLWSKYDPSIYADIRYFMKDSTYYWNFFRDERYPIIKNTKPNKAHYSIVKLEKKGKIYKLITQNIDGFHQIAGSSYVIELHGSTRTFRCINCKNQFGMDDVYQKIKTELPPICKCGGTIRPNTIMFGESLPQNALDEAILSSKKCDMFLVLGSSLVVNPAAQLPIIAKQNNSDLVIVNIDPTPLDSIADIVIHEKASHVLSKVV